ncbi:MAG: GH36 C-terminal domain-containing protein, partial [Lachnospiraceae bacterium]|nr:GH36 C-terminal domain-containing protein [Lachnospiraceae bacterium]
NMTVNYVRLKGLTSGCMYEEQASGNVYPADALMEVGLPLPVEMGEHLAYQMYFVRVS